MKRESKLTTIILQHLAEIRIKNNIQTIIDTDKTQENEKRNL